MDIGEVKRAASRVSFRFSRPGSVPIPGENRTNRRGHGLDFVGYREYQFGDDIRSIDWNVAARQGRPVVKLFEQGYASTLVVVVDGSASMRIGDGDKWRVARELAALFAFIAARESDMVGAVVVTGLAEGELPPRRGLRHADVLARWLDAYRPTGHTTDVGKGIDRALRLLGRSGVVVVVSDFLAPAWDRAIWTAAQRHAVVACSVISPRELHLPDAGLVLVHDAESGEARWIDSGSNAVRAAYETHAVARRHTITSRLRDAGALPVDVHTDRPLVTQLTGVCRVRASA
jgi:uncharacterized protein (DUF58 family)